MHFLYFTFPPPFAPKIILWHHMTYCDVTWRHNVIPWRHMTSHHIIGMFITCLSLDYPTKRVRLFFEISIESRMVPSLETIPWIPSILLLPGKKECVAVLIGLCKKNGAVSSGFVFLFTDSRFIWTYDKYTIRFARNKTQRWLLYWNTLLSQIGVWADIDRNCNTFFYCKRK